MDAYSNKFKCVLHFNPFEERVIMYDDMTYSTLLEFVVKRFNLDHNIQFNLSFNLPAIESDITNDEDVEFFIDCATNSLYDEIPHLYVRPPKVEARIIPGPAGILQKAMLRKKADVQAGGHENILTTQEYVKKVNEDVFEDDHFTQGPWLMAIVYLNGQWVIASGCLGDVEKYCKNGKLELVVGVVNSCMYTKFVGRDDSYIKRSNRYRGRYDSLQSLSK
ncbi:hypothetical protein Tco_0168319 [Tanacetum coccineum]